MGTGAFRDEPRVSNEDGSLMPCFVDENTEAEALSAAINAANVAAAADAARGAMCNVAKHSRQGHTVVNEIADQIMDDTSSLRASTTNLLKSSGVAKAWDVTSRTDLVLA